MNEQELIRKAMTLIAKRKRKPYSQQNRPKDAGLRLSRLGIAARRKKAEQGKP